MAKIRCKRIKTVKFSLIFVVQLFNFRNNTQCVTSHMTQFSFIKNLQYCLCARIFFLSICFLSIAFAHDPVENENSNKIFLIEMCEYSRFNEIKSNNLTEHSVFLSFALNFKYARIQERERKKFVIIFFLRLVVVLHTLDSVWL